MSGVPPNKHPNSPNPCSHLLPGGTKGTYDGVTKSVSRALHLSLSRYNFARPNKTAFVNRDGIPFRAFCPRCYGHRCHVAKEFNGREIESCSAEAAGAVCSLRIVRKSGSLSILSSHDPLAVRDRERTKTAKPSQQDGRSAPCFGSG